MVHEPEERYDGPAAIAGTEVDVLLRGHFEPIDGLSLVGRRRELADRRRAVLRRHRHPGDPARRGRGPTLRHRPVGSFPDQRDGQTTVLNRPRRRLVPTNTRCPATAVAVAGHRRRGS